MKNEPAQDVPKESQIVPEHDGGNHVAVNIVGDSSIGLARESGAGRKKKCAHLSLEKGPAESGGVHSRLVCAHFGLHNF